MAINQAEARIWLATPYFIPTPAILTSLRAAVYRGVDVRLMVPAHSDVRLVRHAARSYYPALLSVGVRVFEYQPAMHHAKVAVFDDDLVLIGSANLDSRSFRLNFECSCFVGGEALNGELAAVLEKDFADSIEIERDSWQRRPWLGRLIDGTAHLLSPLL